MAGHPLYSGQFSRQVRDMIAFGAVKGWSVVQKFGHIDDLGSSLEDVWATGGIYSYPTSASTLEAISTSTNDTAAGSGARTLRVEGLDANFEEISEDITMNGTSATTATTAAFLRVNRAYVLTTGTYGTGSAGNITIRISSAGATQATINNVTADTIAWDYGQTQLARYTVPAGKIAFMSKVTVQAEANKRADIAMYQRQNADTVSAPFSARRVFYSSEGLSNFAEQEFDGPIFFPEKTDIITQARLASGANGRVTVTFALFIGPSNT
jgi:hypothetical protein